MKILVTGATGFVGQPLCAALAQKGHSLTVLVRDVPAAKRLIPAPCQMILWSDLRPGIPALAQMDAVIHLAGESVFSHRWTPSFKSRLQASRVETTELLLKAFEHQSYLPQVWIQASGIGIYGDQGDQPLDEQADTPGHDFLSRLSQVWEGTLFQSSLLQVHQVRRIALRLGTILGSSGGALARLMPLFKLGFGARLGSSLNWVSWVHLEDVIASILKCLDDSSLQGPINVCAPQAVTQAQWAQTLAQQWNRWVLGTVPALGLRWGLGESAQVLLASQRVVPKKLQNSGFQFQYPTFKLALASLFPENPQDSQFETQCFIPKPVEQVFEFFSKASNLETLTPDWLNFQILSQSTPEIQQGTLIDYRLKLFGVPLRWKTRIEHWNPPLSFVDLQLKGPYQRWEHTHTLMPLGSGTLMKDRVLYRVPVPGMRHWIEWGWVNAQIRQIFEYRSQKIQDLFGNG